MKKDKAMSDLPRTIVGGRPAPKTGPGSYPRGIEVLLKKAKVDAEFAAYFFEDPLGAAAAIDLELGDSEAAVLRSIPRETLGSMVKSVFVPRHHRGTFLSRNAALMLALLIATGIPAYAGGGVDAEEYYEYHKEVAELDMVVLQDALEGFREEHGRYPTTEEWRDLENPLVGYVETAAVHDPWGRKYHYRAEDENGVPVRYMLESLGHDPFDAFENVPCVETENGRPFPDLHPIRFVDVDASGWINVSASDEEGAELVLQVRHDYPDTILVWTLNREPLGTTEGDHRMVIRLEGLPAGLRTVAVEDEDGNSALVFIMVTE